MTCLCRNWTLGLVRDGKCWWSLRMGQLTCCWRFVVLSLPATTTTTTTTTTETTTPTHQSSLAQNLSKSELWTPNRSWKLFRIHMGVISKRSCMTWRSIRNSSDIMTFQNDLMNLCGEAICKTRNSVFQISKVKRKMPRTPNACKAEWNFGADFIHVIIFIHVLFRWRAKDPQNHNRKNNFVFWAYDTSHGCSFSSHSTQPAESFHGVFRDLGRVISWSQRNDKSSLV